MVESTKIKANQMAFIFATRWRQLGFDAKSIFCQSMEKKDGGNKKAAAAETGTKNETKVAKNAERKLAENIKREIKKMRKKERERDKDVE